MRSAAWLLSPLAALFAVNTLPAQILVPAPPPGPAVVVGSGITISYTRRPWRLFGGVYVVDPYTLAPVGVVTKQVTVNYYFPRPVIVAPPPDPDLSGVDLDVVPPPWKPQPQKRPPAPPRPKPPPPPAPPAKAKPPAPAPKAPALPEPPPLPADPQAEAALLISNGLKAFADEQYGLAVQRFRRAAVADKANTRARFLLAQTLFALGKYREAVGAIHEGMDLDPNWPRAPFRPRLDLYKGNEATFTAQLKDLEQALDKSPDNRHLLFLYAYALWFDGRQPEAVAFFQRARAVTVDTTYIDRFLRAAPGGAVAAR
jgi:hypothetical protein